MAQRGLKDWEISLIKRMMAEGYARDKMHAYFNQPHRTLTPAAYSEIKAGKFGESIPPASPQLLARFIEAFSRSPAEAERDPMGPATLDRLLAVRGSSAQLVESENDHIEFKSSFSFGDNVFAKIARAMGALANNGGGYILCGVHDASRQVRGLASCDHFECDMARWSQILKGCLMPMPVFERQLVEVAGVKIGVIYVEAASSKPVVAAKSLGDKFRSGAIYYRYPGQSSEIAYGEMAALLAERDRKAQHGLLERLHVFAERPPNQLALIDLKNGHLVNGVQPVQLSKELVDQLSVIREGEFVEQDGAPAVRILANATVEPEAAVPQIVRGFVTDAAAVRNFAHREPVREPRQYLLAAFSSSSDWLPMFRWMREAGLTVTDALELVEGENLTPTRRLRAIERLNGKRTAQLRLAKSVRPTVDRILAHDVPMIGNATELRRLMQAIRMISSVDDQQMAALCLALQRGFDFAWAAGNGGDLQSHVKAAAARIDELEEERRSTQRRSAA